MNRRSWFNNWLNPSNLIALLTLLITAFGVFAGMKFFTKSQVITAEKNCDIYDFKQITSGETNLSQKANCSESQIKHSTQKESK